MDDSPKDNTIHYSSYIALAGVVSLLFLFMFYWVSLEKDIHNLKDDNEKELKRIEKLRTNLLIELNEKQVGDTTIVIRINDIEEINERYDELFLYVRDNTNRAESLINKDLDRLSLYMAMGIGFVGILGIFVPILVNVISVQDLRDKLNKIPNKKRLDQIEIKATNALEKAGKINDIEAGIVKLEEGYQKAIPGVTTLVLQTAIGRFFNVSPYLLTKLARSTEREYFIQVLETIRDGFNYCDISPEHSIVSDEFLKSTITDFRMAITNARFQTTFFNKTVNIKFDELNIKLKELNKSSKANESDINKEIRDKIDEIITELKK